MSKLFLTIILSAGISLAFAQQSKNSASYSKLTIEPALGTGLYSLMGNPDLQISNLVKYNIRKRISVVSHTAFLYGFVFNRSIDVKQNYRYAILQRFGVGTSFYAKRTVTSFYFLAGIRYDSFSGTLQNEELPEKITTKASSVVPDLGMMYHLKIGKKKYFISSRLYVPVNRGVNGMIENITAEIGVGIRIK